MTLACMLHQMNDLSDGNMENQTQVNLEFKYALAMSMDEKDIASVNFHNHRQRLLALELDKVLLDSFTRLMYYLGLYLSKKLVKTIEDFVPYIFTKDEISLILRAADAIGPNKNKFLNTAIADALCRSGRISVMR